MGIGEPHCDCLALVIFHLGDTLVGRRLALAMLPLGDTGTWRLFTQAMPCVDFDSRR